MTTNCIIYTRFSPRPDAATSESCEIQERACREFAERKGWNVRVAYQDRDRSGSDEFRDVLWAAIDSLRRGDVLLVLKRDRLARNVYLAETINRAVNKKGGTIIAVEGDVEGDGPEQQLVRQIVAAMAEYERKLIGRRTSLALRVMQKGGKRVGRWLPFGWREDPARPGMMIREPAEQAVIAEILERRDRGEPYTRIAADLTSRGTFGRWDATRVRRVVVRAEF